MDELAKTIVLLAMIERLALLPAVLFTLVEDQLILPLLCIVIFDPPNILNVAEFVSMPLAVVEFPLIFKFPTPVTFNVPFNRTDVLFDESPLILIVDPDATLILTDVPVTRSTPRVEADVFVNVDDPLNVILPLKTERLIEFPFANKRPVVHSEMPTTLTSPPPPANRLMPPGAQKYTPVPAVAATFLPVKLK